MTVAVIYSSGELSARKLSLSRVYRLIYNTSKPWSNNRHWLRRWLIKTYEWSLVETLWHRLILCKIILVYCLPPISWSPSWWVGSIISERQWTMAQNNPNKRENAVSTPQMKRMPLLVSVATLQAFLLWPYYSGNNGYPATRSWTNLCWKCPSTCLVLSLQPRAESRFLMASS